MPLSVTNDQNWRDFEVSDRIHVMPMGYEVDRVWMAADMLKADRVVVVAHKESDANSDVYRERVKEKLEELNVPCQFEHVNIFNLYEALGMFAKLITEYATEDVYLNIATGSKITAIAGMIACMVTDEDAGATPYYVQAESYDDTPPTGIANITALPPYPIGAPTAEQVEILNFITRREKEEQFPTKGELIEYAEEVQLPFIAERDVQEKGKYRLLDKHIVEPLLADGYIEIVKSGREKYVGITEFGRNTLTAFRFMLKNHNDDNGGSGAPSHASA